MIVRSTQQPHSIRAQCPKRSAALPPSDGPGFEHAPNPTTALFATLLLTAHESEHSHQHVLTAHMLGQHALVSRVQDKPLVALAARIASLSETPKALVRPTAPRFHRAFARHPRTAPAQHAGATRPGPSKTVPPSHPATFRMQSECNAAAAHSNHSECKAECTSSRLRMQPNVPAECCPREGRMPRLTRPSCPPISLFEMFQA